MAPVNLLPTQLAELWPRRVRRSLEHSDGTRKKVQTQLLRKPQKPCPHPTVIGAAGSRRTPALQGHGCHHQCPLPRAQAARVLHSSGSGVAGRPSGRRTRCIMSTVQRSRLRQEGTRRQGGVVLAPESWLLTPVELLPAASLPCCVLSPQPASPLLPVSVHGFSVQNPDVHPSPLP